MHAYDCGLRGCDAVHFDRQVLTFPSSGYKRQHVWNILYLNAKFWGNTADILDMYDGLKTWGMESVVADSSYYPGKTGQDLEISL
jgi:hypothetical protein